MDQHGTRHPYPRESDPFYERNVSIAATTATTISVNVGTCPFKEYPATAGAGTTYYHTNGDLVIGVGTHDINPGTSIKLRKSSLIFTCTKDGNTTRTRQNRNEILELSFPRKTIDNFPKN